MAHVDKNIVTDGLSGSLGKKVVFRKKADGGTVLTTRPKHRKTSTDAQSAHRDRFKVATMYAKKVLTNAELKRAYRDSAKPGISAYAYAVADYLTPPKIKEVNLKDYTGQPGSKISILAIDNFRIKAVDVAITNGDDKPVENGVAEKNPEGLDWIYTATAVNENLPGSKVVVTVTDTPGHAVKSENSV